MNSSLYINPYILSLRDHIRKLRVELLYQLNQWYHLKNILYPEIRHTYKNLFGDLEYSLEDKRKAAKDLDLRVRQIVSMLNNNKTVSKNFLINTYNLSFTKSETDTSDANTDIFDIINKEFEKSAVPENELNTEYEIMMLYRQIAKKVHPDINGENDIFNKYWNNIHDAYRAKNLSRIRLFHKLICEEFPLEFPDSRIEESYLKMEIQQYEKSINIEKQKLSKIKTEEPFCFVEKFDDPNWVNRKRHLLTSEIYIAEQSIRKNKTFLKKIIDKSPEQIKT